MKKYLLLSLLFLLAVPLISFAGNTPCTRTGTGAIDTAAGTFPNCNTTPQGYDVTIYKLGVCTANPSPSAATNPDFSTCHMLIDGAGQYTPLAAGKAIALPGATLPPEGTYGYAVLVVSNSIGITNTQTFSTAKTGGAGGSGTTCWTLAGTIDTATNFNASTLAQCGLASAAAPAVTFAKQDDFDGSNGDPSTGGTFDAIANCSSCSSANGVLSAKLAKTDLTTAVAGDFPNGITRIIAVEAFNATHLLRITRSTSNLNVSFNVTNASDLGFTGGGTTLRQFGSGPFSVEITAK